MAPFRFFVSYHRIYMCKITSRLGMSRAKRSRVEGSLRAAGSSKVSGPRMSGPRMSGPRMSGPRMSGPSVNRQRVSRPSVNRQRVSRPSRPRMDGSKVDGSSRFLQGRVPYICHKNGTRKSFRLPSADIFYCIGTFLATDECDECEQLQFQLRDNWEDKRKCMPKDLHAFLVSCPSTHGLIKELNQENYVVTMPAAAFLKSGCLGHHVHFVHFAHPTDELYFSVQQSFVHEMVRKRTSSVEQLIVHQFIDCDMGPLNVKRMVAEQWSDSSVFPASLEVLMLGFTSQTPGNPSLNPDSVYSKLKRLMFLNLGGQSAFHLLRDPGEQFPFLEKLILPQDNIRSKGDFRQCHKWATTMSCAQWPKSLRGLQFNPTILLFLTNHKITSWIPPHLTSLCLAPLANKGQFIDTEDCMIHCDTCLNFVCECSREFKDDMNVGDTFARAQECEEELWARIHEFVLACPHLTTVDLRTDRIGNGLTIQTPVFSKNPTVKWLTIRHFRFDHWGYENVFKFLSQLCPNVETLSLGALTLGDEYVRFSDKYEHPQADHALLAHLLPDLLLPAPSKSAQDSKHNATVGDLLGLPLLRKLYLDCGHCSISQHCAVAFDQQPSTFSSRIKEQLTDIYVSRVNLKTPYHPFEKTPYHPFENCCFQCSS
jgi:hypothetical protein